MATRLLQLDDIRQIQNPDRIASLFQKLGYNACSDRLDVRDLELPARSTEATKNAYLIANQGKSELQVLLFQLQPQEFSTPSIASNRMRSIATSLCRRPSNFLLLGTRDYNQLMLVNPRKNFDERMNLKVGIRKLLIDRTNPTAYDRDRLEAIAVANQTPQELYTSQCEAFDVEKLTKQFFNGYKDLFNRVKQTIKQHNPHPYFENDDRLRDFSQKLLGRLMFLYFLQKKEFLAGDRSFLNTQYRLLKSDLEDTDFYMDVLEPLFFETLNKSRPDAQSVWGKIPYLNGGLFNRDYGAGINDAGGMATPEKVEIPNFLFDPGESKSVLSFFNSYNFTVAENVEGDEDVAVDPEMLGKVFENMLEVEERGKSGTFYTPRSIVHFMCTQVLSRYLADETRMDEEKVKKIINFDPDLSLPDFKELMTPKQAKQLRLALQNLKCLDPAVGSAAFPMGMMQVILNVYQSIARREGNPIQRGSLAMSRLKRNIIANNLYGVDIKPEAIEIAKLRMWLSLVVDIPDIDDVEPLPNLEYKLMRGDSVISTINGEVLIPEPTKNRDAIQLQLKVTPIQQAILPLLELQQQYFDAQTQERSQLKKEILEAETNIFRVAIAERRSVLESEDQKLDRTINKKGKLTKNSQKKKAAIADQLSELNKLLVEVEEGKRSLSFFQYYLHFRDVFEVKGGFDIVVGNPPYVRQEEIKELKPALKQEFECFTGKSDLYVYFFEKGYRLLRSGGALTYITSNKYFRSGYGEKLRQYLGERATVEHLIDFGDTSVFEAIAYPSIIQVSKAKPENHQTRILKWDKTQPLSEFANVFKTQSFHLDQKELTPDGWRLETPEVLRLLDKLRNAGTPLGEYVNGRFYRGIVTGCNKAFVVDRATRDRLIAEHPSSAEVLKPFLRGKDVKRWNVEKPDLWLIFTRRGIEINDYPAIHNYLFQYKQRLTPGIKGGRKAGSYKWYEIQDNIAYFQEFESSKIIIPAITNNVEYAPDYQGYFSNDKTSICITDNIDYLLGLLNSKILWWLIQKTAPTKQGGFYEFKPAYVSKLPIVKAQKLDCGILSSLVQKCIKAKDINSKVRDIQQWEAEINDRVAHL